jgi:hypothetical protein
MGEPHLPTALQIRIDNATTFEEYKVLTDEVKALYNAGPGIHTNVDADGLIFILGTALSFNSNRLLQARADDAEALNIRNLARRTALFALNHIRDWIIKEFVNEKDIRFFRNHLITLSRDYNNGYMQKPEPYLWGMLISICLQKLIALQSIEGCTMLVKILNELKIKVPGIDEDDEVQIRDMEFAKKNIHHLESIIQFLQKNNEDVGNKPMCLVTNDTFERYLLELKGHDMRGARGDYKSKLQDINDDGTECTRNVYYDKVHKVFYVRKNKSQYPIVPDVLAFTLMEELKKRRNMGASAESDARDMQARVAEFQKNEAQSD